MEITIKTTTGDRQVPVISIKKGLAIHRTTVQWNWDDEIIDVETGNFTITQVLTGMSAYFRNFPFLDIAEAIRDAMLSEMAIDWEQDQNPAQVPGARSQLIEIEARFFPTK